MLRKIILYDRSEEKIGIVMNLLDLIHYTYGKLI